MPDASPAVGSWYGQFWDELLLRLPAGMVELTVEVILIRAVPKVVFNHLVFFSPIHQLVFYMGH